MCIGGGQESPWCSKRFKATGAKAQTRALCTISNPNADCGGTRAIHDFCRTLLCACDDSTGSGTDVPTQTAGEPGKPGLNSGGSTDDPMGGHSTGGVPTIGDTDQPSPGGSSQLCMPGQPLQCVTDAVLAVCNAEGTGIMQMPCPDGSQCEEGECVGDTPPPMGGEMNEPDVPRPPSGGNCQNGQRVCIDANRTGVCREGSDVYEDVQTCPAGASLPRVFAYPTARSVAKSEAM